MSNVIEIKGLSKHFDGFAIDDLSLELKCGYIMGFIGPNGAGKTTTIKLILNLLNRDGGSIQVFGQDNIAHEEAIKGRIGVVTDKPFYVDRWTLSEVGRALKPFYAQWDDRRYQELLAQFGLDAKKKVKDLSRGMKMKLMIAAALSHQAELLILDEPTSGLDAVARNELMEILADYISDEGRSVLFSTHITTDLEKAADYITFINDGRIVYSDTKDELLERYCLVKGGSGLLSAEQQGQVIGYRENAYGFDGLAERALVPTLPSSVIAEPSSLDEIVVRFNMGKGEER